MSNACPTLRLGQALLCGSGVSFPRGSASNRRPCVVGASRQMGAKRGDVGKEAPSHVILSAVQRSEESFEAVQVRSSGPAVTSTGTVLVARSALVVQSVFALKDSSRPLRVTRGWLLLCWTITATRPRSALLPPPSAAQGVHLPRRSRSIPTSSVAPSRVPRRYRQ